MFKVHYVDCGIEKEQLVCELCFNQLVEREEVGDWDITIVWYEAVDTVGTCDICDDTLIK